MTGCCQYTLDASGENDIAHGESASYAAETVEKWVWFVVNDDTALVRLDAPNGGDDKRGKVGDIGSVDVDLVFECDARFVDVGQVEGVLTSVIRDSGDEGGVRGDFF